VYTALDNLIKGTICGFNTTHYCHRSVRVMVPASKSLGVLLLRLFRASGSTPGGRLRRVQGRGAAPTGGLGGCTAQATNIQCLKQ